MNDYPSQPADSDPAGEQPATDQHPTTDQHPAGEHPAGEHGRPAYQRSPSGYEALYRPGNGRMIAGVAAGIAQYLGIDVTIVRIAFAVLTVIGGAGIPVY